MARVETRDTHTAFWWGKPEEKKSLGIPWCDVVNVNEMEGWLNECFMHAGMNFRVRQDVGNFLNS